MIKQPNPTMKHNQDWSEVDLESMPERFLPATAYYPNSSMKTYESDYGIWDIAETVIPVASTFRLAWRAMANLTARRTFFPAVIPPKSKHIHGIACAGPISSENLAPLASSSAFLIDYFLRASGFSFITNRVVVCFTSAQVSVLTFRLRNNFLSLNCLTSAYSPIWEAATGTPWTIDTPIRLTWDRQQDQHEIHAIVALSLGATA